MPQSLYFQGTFGNLGLGSVFNSDILEKTIEKNVIPLSLVLGLPKYMPYLKIGSDYYSLVCLLAK